MINVLSLGAGVQSSTMALMSAKGELPKADCAIFADTGYEPKAIYNYLNYYLHILVLNLVFAVGLNKYFHFYRRVHCKYQVMPDHLP